MDYEWWKKHEHFCSLCDHWDRKNKKRVKLYEGYSDDVAVCKIAVLRGAKKGQCTTQDWGYDCMWWTGDGPNEYRIGVDENGNRINAPSEARSI